MSVSVKIITAVDINMLIVIRLNTKHNALICLIQLWAKIQISFFLAVLCVYI